MKPLEDKTVVVPEEASLQCTISPGDPEARITWSKDDKEIKGKDDRVVSTYVDSKATLTFKNVNLKDAARYRVEASNKMGRVETECRLTVHSKSILICNISTFHVLINWLQTVFTMLKSYHFKIHLFSILVAPKITHDDKLGEPQKLKAGGILSLYANIEGVPTPKVWWYRNGEPIKSINGTSIDTKDTFTSLSVKGSTGKDSGKYKLVAENVAGKDEKEFDVTVKGIFLMDHILIVDTMLIMRVTLNTSFGKNPYVDCLNTRLSLFQRKLPGNNLS